MLTQLYQNTFGRLFHSPYRDAENTQSSAEAVRYSATEEAVRYITTEENISKYSTQRKKGSIDSAVNETIVFLKSNSWNAWKFKKSGHFRFGVLLDWPQYDGHLQQQADLIRKVCDKIGGEYDLSSLGKNTLIPTGGAYAIYLGFSKMS